MYQHALKLKAAIVDGASFVEMAQAQLEAIMIAINALSLIDSRNAWIVIPKSLSNAVRTVFSIPCFALTDPRLFTDVLPLTMFPRTNSLLENVMLRLCISQICSMTVHCCGHRLISSARIRAFWLLKASLSGVQSRLSDHISSSEFLLPPALVVMRLVNKNFYEQALMTARALDVNMTDTFSQLTVHCLRLKNTPDGTSWVTYPTSASYFGLTSIFSITLLDSLADGADWLLTDKVVSWSRTPAERGWNYLQQSLERHDSLQTDYRYSKTVLDTILTHEKGTAIPPWLVRTLEVCYTSGGIHGR